MITYIAKNHLGFEVRVTVATAEHITDVVNVGGRFPYLPTCTCGDRFWGYVAPHAAQDRADAHVQANSPKGR